MSLSGGLGTDQITLWLDCPTDGNKDLLAYCRENYGDNYPVKVPANQGIFVVDTKTGEVHRVHQTRITSPISSLDFLRQAPGRGWK